MYLLLMVLFDVFITLTIFIIIINIVIIISILQNIGEFVLTSSNVRIPEKGHIYSINEGYSKFWYAPVEKYIESLKNPQVGISCDYKLDFDNFWDGFS